MGSDTIPRPERGEIWLVSFGAGRTGEPAKHRPAVVLTPGELHTGSAFDLVIVVPLTSTLPPSLARPRIAAGQSSGLDTDSATVVRGVRGVAVGRLVRRLGKTEPGTYASIIEVLKVLTDGSPVPR